VDGRGVGRNQRVEFAKPVGDGAVIEAGGELAALWISIVDVADVAVVMDRGTAAGTGSRVDVTYLIVMNSPKSHARHIF
jgi:hypothetical protein